MNELVKMDEMDLAQIAELAGADPQAQRVGGIPELKVNMDDEDDKGNSLPRGYLYVRGAETPVYAKEVTFRVLAQNYQYTHYDPDNNAMKNKSIVTNNMRAEFIDEKGTTRCGSPTSKEKKLLPEDERKRYDNISCVRQLRGIVSYTGETKDGEKMEVKDQPCILRLKGSNFMPFQGEVFDAIPNGKMLWDFDSKITLERLKNGTVVYFVMHFEPDFSKEYGLTGDSLETMKYFLTKIAEENKSVRQKYEDALREKSMSKRLANDSQMEGDGEGYPYNTLDDDLGD